MLSFLEKREMKMLEMELVELVASFCFGWNKSSVWIVLHLGLEKQKMWKSVEFVVKVSLKVEIIASWKFHDSPLFVRLPFPPFSVVSLSVEFSLVEVHLVLTFPFFILPSFHFLFLLPLPPLTRLLIPPPAPFPSSPSLLLLFKLLPLLLPLKIPITSLLLLARLFTVLGSEK